MFFALSLLTTDLVRNKFPHHAPFPGKAFSKRALVCEGFPSERLKVNKQRYLPTKENRCPRSSITTPLNLPCRYRHAWSAQPRNTEVLYSVLRFCGNHYYFTYYFPKFGSERQKILYLNPIRHYHKIF